MTSIGPRGRWFAGASMKPQAAAWVYRNRTLPVSRPVFFQACGMSRGMKAQVPGPPTVTSSPHEQIDRRPMLIPADCLEFAIDQTTGSAIFCA